VSSSNNPWVGSDAPKGRAYDVRWEQLAAAGKDVHGEANFVARLEPRSVLDAGCGTGRVAIELARRGLDVVGVDIDTSMLAAARDKAPELAWVEADLATMRLDRTFDVALMAGNVMIFLTPGTAGAVVERVAAHLDAGGRLVSGFQLGRALDLTTYDGLCADAGLALDARFATWDADAFVGGGDYAVSVHTLVSRHA
jgi:SAM-dependent methyltransferase